MRTNKILFSISKYLLIGILCIIFLIIILYFILILPPVQNYLLTVLRPVYQKALPAKINIEKFRSNLISRVKLTNVTLTDSANPLNYVFLKTVDIEIWLPALIFKIVDIKTIILDSVSVNLVMKGDTLPFVAKKPQRKASFNLLIDSISIRKLSVNYKNPVIKMETSIHDADIETKFLNKDSLLLKIKCSRSYFESQWWTGNIDSLMVDGVKNKKNVFVNRLQSKGSDLTSNIKGLIPVLLSGKIDLKGNVSTLLNTVNVIKNNPNLSTRGSVNINFAISGTIEAPVININLASQNLAVQQIPVDTLHVLGKYLNNVLITELKINSTIVSGEMHSESKIFQLLQKPLLGSYHATLVLNAENFYQLKNLIPWADKLPIRNIVIDGTINGNSLDRPVYGKFDMVIKSLQKKIDEAYLHLLFQEQMWNINGEWGKNSISGTGTLSDNLRYNGKLNLRIPNPELFTTILVNQKITGNLTSDINFNGSKDKTEIKSMVNAKDINWKEVTISELKGGLNYLNGLITFSELRAKINGTYDSLLRFFKVDSVGGMGKLTIVANGTYPNMHTVINADLNKIIYKNFSIKRAKGNIDLFSIDSAVWDRFTIALPRTELITSGNAMFNQRKSKLQVNMESQIHNPDLASDGKVAVSVAIHKKQIIGKILAGDVPLSIINEIVMLPQNISGFATISAEISGSLGNPKGTSIFKINDPSLNNMKIGLIRGNLQLADSEITINSQIRLIDTSKEILAFAYLPIRPALGWSIDTTGMRQREIMLTGDTFNLSDLHLLSDSTVTIKGTGNLSIKMTGTKTPWIINGIVKVSNGEVYYVPMDIRAKQIELSSSMSGNTVNPMIKFNLTTGKIESEVASLIATKWIGRLENNTIKLDTGYALVSDQSKFIVDGSIPIVSIDTLLKSSKLAINYKIINIPLKLLQPVLQGIDISDGVVDGNGTVFIRNGRLQSDGIVNVKNGILESDLIEQKIGPFGGSIELQEDSIFFKNWKGKIADGEFTISGSSSLIQNDGIGLNVQMHGKNIAIDVPEIIKLYVQSLVLQLKNSRTKGKYLLDGTIVFGPTTFIRDIQITDMIAMSNQQKPPIKKHTVFDQLELQLELQFLNNLYIDMNLGNMQLEGSLALSGSANNPGFVGQINTVEGSVYYLDRKFDVTKGSLNFINPYEFNPTIYLDANTEVNTFTTGTNQNVNYTINLNVTGNLQHPNVALTSSPTLTEPNIISLLTLGTMLNTVGSNVASRIGSLIGNEFLGFGTKKLERLLNLENISVTGNIFDLKNQNGPKISLTKSITHRLTLSYETAIGNTNQQKVTILYRIFPYLFLSGQTDNTGNSSVNLKFRINR